MRVLIDTNVVLDFLLQRDPFFQDAEMLFQAIGSGEVVGSVLALSSKHQNLIPQKMMTVVKNL